MHSCVYRLVHLRLTLAPGPAASRCQTPGSRAPRPPRAGRPPTCSSAAPPECQGRGWGRRKEEELVGGDLGDHIGDMVGGAALDNVPGALSGAVLALEGVTLLLTAVGLQGGLGGEGDAP